MALFANGGISKQLSFSLSCLQSQNEKCGNQFGRLPRMKVQAKGLFGWLENNKDVEGRDEQWEIQQQILRNRRKGAESNMMDRRTKVSMYMKGKLPKDEMKKIQEKNRKAAAALSKEAVKGGIPLPMASFGMPEFDGGERFDLKGPYVDEGWVDEKESPGFFENIFGGKNKKPKTVTKNMKKN
mmetsp:Transcript_29652/g.40946  ORF Transcript_29652/g.40946 Transcript_29652/m.40946 type:complete len:183 (+) Transcript_29652:96-644(+)|eukprot:CAMPEP_0196571256 /NCGR_PEP_ID=MMETSP1081-20130531/1445_1 /TAXON_ID=36882 /ORGANISM="Pyramimonas amylifera, Strain CCMP720" /LENGTH=182 /DNA_ID=CAMNT_0041888125 /DNA_START=92 /DNA_END=640 /DNA_ORIENTATION=-